MISYVMRYILCYIIVIIMAIHKCYFSREHIALSYKNGVNITFGKQTDKSTVHDASIIFEINNLCFNNPRQGMKTKSI